jgi:hypothetical protein
MLDDVKSQIDRRVIISGVVGLVLGCLFGWMVLGWTVFPVTWTNADPVDLRPAQKDVYVTLVADSYSVNQDANLARQRLAGFDKAELSDILARLIEENDKAGNAEEKGRLQNLATVMQVAPAGGMPGPQATPATGAARALSAVRSLLPLCGLAIVLLIIVAVISVIIFRLLQQRPPGRAVTEPGEERPTPEVGREETLGRFTTTYNFGDDAYDTSFNIETHGPDAEFFGACGVGFSEVLGEGSPDKIAAFEVWIFDKTDMDNVQTVTKVLMSEFAYGSQVLRDKMRDRGEAVLAEKGKVINIEAVGLQLSAEVIDMQYGSDPSLPPNSYFEKLTTRLVPSFRT